MVFLDGRLYDKNSANLIACGVGGWVDFWNIHGGGLLGETIVTGDDNFIKCLLF